MAQAQTRKPLDRPQTEEEKAFYARNHLIMTICALIFFPPFGLLGIYFTRKTNEANLNSDWEDAYLNSSRIMWMDVLGILLGLGLIYVFVLYM